MYLFSHFAFAIPLASLQYQSSRDNPIFTNLTATMSNAKDYLLLTDLTAGYSFTAKNTGISPGLICRHLMNNAAFGGYLYSAYNLSPDHQSFWTANPGIEFLDPTWHINLNLYIPLNNDIQTYGQAQFANQVGIFDYVKFAGHQQFDRLVKQANQTGYGADGIISFNKLPFAKPASISIGTYYFNMLPNLFGISVRSEFSLNDHFSTTLNYRYDTNRHSTFSIGLILHNTNTSDVWSSMPAQHNIAELGNANTIPINHQFSPVSGSQLFRDNIWFFKPNNAMLQSSVISSIDDCTFEHPCNHFSAASPFEIAFLTSNANIYLKPGNYTISNALFLVGNQSLYGRSNNYIEAASNAQKPLLTVRQLIIADNSNNTLSDLRLENNGSFFAGIALYHTNNVTLNNIDLGTLNTLSLDKNYITGIIVNDSNNIYINNSSINANNYNTAASDPSTDLTLINSTNITVNNSRLIVKSSGDNNFGSVSILALSGPSTIHVYNSILQSDNSGYNNKGALNIVCNGTAEIEADISRSSLIANSVGTGNQSYAANVLLSNHSHASINNTSLIATNNSRQSNGGSVNAFISDNSELNISNVTASATSSSTEGIGAGSNFDATDYSKLTIFGSQLYSSGNSQLVTGTTNLTMQNHATAVVNNSVLITEMAGGETMPGMEDSGAVSLWLLNDASIRVNNSSITATSNNRYTSPVALQAQDNSTTLIESSTLQANQLYGNQSSEATELINMVNNAKVTINNSTLTLNVAGLSTFPMSMLSVSNTSTLNLFHNILVIHNAQRDLNGQTPTAVGIFTDPTTHINEAENILLINNRLLPLNVQFYQ